MKGAFGIPTEDDNYHEICPCEDCHEAGGHEEAPEDWARTVNHLVMGIPVFRRSCFLCVDVLADQAQKWGEEKCKSETN